MTTYTVDAVAMARYLVDKLPSSADEIFRRAEDGIDVLEAPPVTVSEVMYTAAKKGVIAGVDVETTPNAVLQGVVTQGPVRVVSANEHDLAVMGSLLDHHTMHDALLIANHRVRGTDAIISNDGAFSSEPLVWD